VYMLLGLVQGGELFSLLHQDSYDGVSEKDAKFYAAGILEGLSHASSAHIVP
jgi:protein kinase A